MTPTWEPSGLKEGSAAHPIVAGLSALSSAFKCYVRQKISFVLVTSIFDICSEDSEDYGGDAFPWRRQNRGKSQGDSFSWRSLSLGRNHMIHGSHENCSSIKRSKVSYDFYHL